MIPNTENFYDAFTDQEQNALDAMNSPKKIQDFLDAAAYPSGDENRSPLEVFRQKQAHCLDGALFAAALLRLHGYTPLIVDLLPVPGRDDDHVLALYRSHGAWGAVAKSNFSGLRFREPVYRTVRELVLSYFEFFFNLNGEKTLRRCTRQIDLSRFDHTRWMTESSGVDFVEKYLKNLKGYPLITKSQAEILSSVDERSFQAGMLGINRIGAFSPPPIKKSEYEE